MSVLGNDRLRPLFLLQFGAPLTPYPSYWYSNRKHSSREKFRFWYYHRGFQKFQDRYGRELPDDDWTWTGAADYPEAWQSYCQWHKSFYDWWHKQKDKHQD